MIEKKKPVIGIATRVSAWWHGRIELEATPWVDGIGNDVQVLGPRLVVSKPARFSKAGFRLIASLWREVAIGVLVAVVVAALT